MLHLAQNHRLFDHRVVAHMERFNQECHVAVEQVGRRNKKK